MSPDKPAAVSTTDQLKDVLSQIGKESDVTTVYGETQLLEGRAVIPVAQLRYQGGGGLGGGVGPAQGSSDGATEDDALSHGEGMGVGFNVSVRPLGVIEVTADEVAWIPIIDVSRLSIIWSAVLGLLAAIATASLLFGRR